MWRELFTGFIEVFHLTLGRYILPKTRARIIFKNELKDIIERFADCVDYHRKNCSLESIIGSGIEVIRWMFDIQKGTGEQKIDESEGKKIQSKFLFYLKESQILGEWFTLFQDRLDSIYLKDTLKIYREFSFIFRTTGRIFADFLKSSTDSIRQELKKAEGYATFKRIYNNTATDLEKLTQRTSKKLKKEIKPDSFQGLLEL